MDARPFIRREGDWKDEDRWGIGDNPKDTKGNLNYYTKPKDCVESQSSM
jgi:hypothetical protein